MRVKTGIVRRRRHNKVRHLTKGYRNARHARIKTAKEAIIKAGQHSYIDRRKKKRVFRSLWIVRLNAAVRAQGMNYSTFISGLIKKNIGLDRKALSELAIHHPEAFASIVKTVKGA